MIDYLYPCGFAAIGLQVTNNKHVLETENYFSTETVMLKAGEKYIHYLMVYRTIRIDLITAMGPCVLSSVRIGLNRIPTGMNARLVVAKCTASIGDQVIIEFTCKPEIFMLRQDNESASKSR